MRVVYKIYGDHVDGTYLGIDPTHAHMNMPATLLWARGLEARGVRVTFEPPKGSSWVVATQLFPTDSAWTFTAPNLQYLMDSPDRAQRADDAHVHGPRRRRQGRDDSRRRFITTPATPRSTSTSQAREKIVKEHGAVFGEFPQFEPGYLHLPRRLRAVGRR